MSRGLLSGERRKSVERMVLRELDGDVNQMRRLQYFAADSPLSDQPFPERHRQAVGAELGTREGIFVVPRTRVRLAPGAPASMEARALAAQLPAEAWTRRGCRGTAEGRSMPTSPSGG